MNSEVSKLLSITVRDIRINKDINDERVLGAERADSSTSNKSDLDVIDFRGKRVSPLILKFAQFVSVHVQNISMVVMNNSCHPSWFMHATAADLHLDGNILHSSKTLIVTASLNETHVSHTNEASKICPLTACVQFFRLSFSATTFHRRRRASRRRSRAWPSFASAFRWTAR